MKQPQPGSEKRFSLLKTFFAFLVLFLPLAGIELKAAADAPPPLMKITLKPGPVNGVGLIAHVDVSIVLPSADAPAGEALLMMPAVYINIETAAKTMTDFEARDAAGILPMETKDDPPGGPVYFRRWIPTRPVKGDLFVRYRAPIDPRPQTRSEVPIVLRSEDGGFHGGGTFFVLSPAAAARYGLQIHWDLDALGPQARGISSLGDNDIEVAEAGAADQLTSVFFMAGPMSRYPANPAPGGFSAAWLTRPPFDPLPLMAWAEKLYNSYRSFFKTEGEKPYRVFLRTNRVNAGGGIGLVNSFVATFDDKTKAEDLKLLLAHEMFHTFAPSLEKESEHGMGSTQWFTEGLAIYYQRLLPLRAGLIEPAVFLADLNLTAGRYYTNLLNGTPNDQIAPRFWEDTRIRVLPYDRGSMYLAVVDSKIRKASGGKRSLDDLLLTLLDRQKKGLAVGPETWVELVTGDLGPAAKEEYEAMLAGAVMVPASDAFGPEYERTVVPLRRFELGFDAKVMLEHPSVIHGLVSGSEAERAGLRDGDEILLVSAGLDSVQEDQKRLLTLKVRREGKDVSITYLPRGETVDAYQWVRAAGQAADRAPVVSMTEHTGTFNGCAIKYTATVAETFIPDKDGKPAASIVTTTYLRKDIENAAARPVLFGFNGGPGASSTPLHLSALGPRRWVEVTGERAMGDNPFSPLADIDLVFIDPIGTGFSRPLPGVDGQPFWSVTGDADSVVFFIKDWLKIHGREASPRFLCGESYGTARAAQIIGTHRDLKFDGVILISMMGGMENPDLSQIMEFPTYATTAAFHGKVDAAGRQPEEIFNEALKFARDEYLPALVQGTALPAEEKARLAGEMAKRIGLPASYLAAKDLRLSPSDFMLGLLADRGLRIGQIDARVTGKLEDFAGQTPPGDDPSMASSKAAPGSAMPKPAAKSATQGYFNEELKYPDTEKYNPLNFVINGKWIFDADRPLKDPVGLVGEVMREQPQLRLFWAAGYYDITTPLYAGKYTLEHSGAPADRLTIAAYPTGHMVYDGDENLDRFVKSVVKFTKSASSPAAAVQASAAPMFEIQMKPVLGADGEPEAVEVRERFSGPERPKDAGQPSFQAPTLYAGVPGIADTFENLEIRDAVGRVSLAKTDDPTDKGGFVFYRHWRTERAVMYPFEVRYRAHMYPTTKRNGPPWHLRPAAGGVSAAGAGFLLLPEDPGEYQIRLHWDLSGMAPNSIGVMSLGEGDVALTGTADQLLNSWYMAGPVGRYPAKGDVSGFSAIWLGEFPFDPVAAMTFAAKAYVRMCEFFGETNPAPYRVFMRALKTPPVGGGTALPRSFMLSMGTTPRNSADSDPRGTIVHEMMHDFTGGIEGPEGITAWFSEGLTVFYTNLLPMRTGLWSIDEYLAYINEEAKSYYSNPGRNFSAEEIVKVGFGDERIRHVPYARGFLYFADLDARIREASGGKRKLDNFILEIFALRKAGEKIDQEKWLEAVTKEIGPSARAEFEAVILRGEMIVPASGAFGPGFERKPVKYVENGKEINGFEWVRVPSVTDAQCREW